jgi:hypothetical protein
MATEGFFMDRKTFSDILNPGREALQYLQKTANIAKNSVEYAVANKFTKNNADEMGIVAALLSVASSGHSSELSEMDYSVLEALQRSNHALADAPLEDIQLYLGNLDGSQITGLISNVKGILHEMLFVEVENSDGDSIFASTFASSNHPDTDIQFTDRSTGEVWEAQLKATDSSSYAQEWINQHPDGEILVTSELAEKMGLASSGFSNEGITVHVTDFVDRMIELGDSSGLWSLFPVFAAASVSVVLYELWGRYKRGELNEERFRKLAALTTGLKISKIALLIAALSTPLIGPFVTVWLVLGLLINAKRAWFDRPPMYTPTEDVSKAQGFAI